jgi:hypothetical protein
MTPTEPPVAHLAPWIYPHFRSYERWCWTPGGPRLHAGETAVRNVA